MILHDHLGRRVDVPAQPARIVSLCPSQTETLFELGAGAQVVGVTNWCIHPDEARSKTAVGGTKKVNLNRLHALKPDLILAEKEEQTRELVEALAAHYPVYVTDVRSLSGARTMITDLGQILGLTDQAAKMVQDIDSHWRRLAGLAGGRKVLYFIWQEPYMVVGADTYIHDVLTHLGFRNLAATTWQERYPSASVEALQQLQPDFVFLSSEPYRYTEEHVAQYRQLFPAAKVLWVDGEMLSWYGSRMRKAAEYLHGLISGLGIPGT
ncbi:MAG: ABC transporter substrate-binding protein [Sphingobacteriia bacterium]|jgi:ABC-type Fe3+-hydroxamate transport system substrate-binding protein